MIGEPEGINATDTRARNNLVLAHREGQYSWLSVLTDVDSVLDQTLADGEQPLADIDTTFVIRRLDEKIAENYHRSGADQERWLDTNRGSAERPEAGIRRYHSPSAAEPSGPKPKFRLEELPGSAIYPNESRRAEL